MHIKCLSFIIFFCVLFCSCTKDEKKENLEKTAVSKNTADNNSTIVSLSLLIGENHDLLTDHYWTLMDGRRLADRSTSTIDWVGPMTPRVIFYKLEIPSRSVFYQYRLRREQFMLLYQTEEQNKLRILENTFVSGIYSFEFNSNFTNFMLRRNDVPYGVQERVGQQANHEYPLVGIWGSLPHLTEYRLVDPAGCLYYMEIDKDIPFFVVREGTYLLKQIDEKTFETVSAFSDGRLRLEITGEGEMLLTPLFTLPDDEEGIVGSLIMHRSPFRISDFSNEEDPFNLR